MREIKPGWVFFGLLTYYVISVFLTSKERNNLLDYEIGNNQFESSRRINYKRIISTTEVYGDCMFWTLKDGTLGRICAGD